MSSSASLCLWDQQGEPHDGAWAGYDPWLALDALLVAADILSVDDADAVKSWLVEEGEDRWISACDAAKVATSLLVAIREKREAGLTRYSNEAMYDFVSHLLVLLQDASQRSVVFHFEFLE